MEKFTEKKRLMAQMLRELADKLEALPDWLGDEMLDPHGDFDRMLQGYWQPIETAPRDGTQILLCRAWDAEGRAITGDSWGLHVQVAAWWGDKEDGEWIVYCSFPDEPRLFFEPTHWMPVPRNPLA